MTTPQGPLVFVGTYSLRGSVGIYVFRLDPATGALSQIGEAACENPTFLALSSDARVLYAVHETHEYEGRPGGSVSAFAVDGAAGTLHPLGRQAARGLSPCHVTASPGGRRLLVANYGDGTHTILPLANDGRLGAATGQITNAGRPGPGQKSGHAHCTRFPPDGRYALACDLGLDRVLVYAWDEGRGTLRESSSLALPPGAGPRHLAFHPTLPRVYVINELNSSVAVLAYDAEAGTLTPLQTLSTLPADFTGHSSCADIHVSPDGRFLYGSNRGHDSLAVFAIDGDGRLSVLGHTPTGGRTPRSFAVLPDRLILVAHQDTDTIVAFRAGPDGLPVPTGAVTHVPAPVCVLPMPLPSRHQA